MKKRISCKVKEKKKRKEKKTKQNKNKTNDYFRTSNTRCWDNKSFVEGGMLSRELGEWDERMKGKEQWEGSEGSAKSFPFFP